MLFYFVSNKATEYKNKTTENKDETNKLTNYHKEIDTDYSFSMIERLRARREITVFR